MPEVLVWSVGAIETTRCTHQLVIEYKTKEVYRFRQRAAHITEYDMNGEGSYILEIQTSDGKWCLDATRRMDSLGHLMNHSVCPSLKPFKPLFANQKWRVGFLAVHDIAPGEEITWDYGAPPEGHKWLFRRPPQTPQAADNSNQLGNLSSQSEQIPS